MQVTHMDGIFDDVVTELVRLAVADAAFDSATCHPCGEATRMVVTSVFLSIFVAHRLGKSGSAKFPGKNNQGIVEQTTSLEISEQAGDRLIHILNSS